MNVYKYLCSLAVCLIASVAAFAQQQSHWKCNPHDFEYDMTAYVAVKKDGVPVVAADVELAAFVDGECRGVADLMPGMDGVYYLRIRSNSSQGETVTFRFFADGEEFDLQGEDVVFASQDIVGLPSDPLVMNCCTVLPGDVNGDREISAMDITLLISYYLGQNPAGFIEAAADLNGDGEISAMDITLLISKCINE